MGKKIKIGKAYSNVFDMLRETYPDNPEYAEAAAQSYEKQKIANLLFILRNRLRLTQEEVAKRMGVTQSAIAKMEDRGELLRFNDLAAYARALDHNILLQVTDNKLTLADMMRWHLERTVEIMESLETLAADDPDIKAGILGHFTGEVRKMLAEVLPKWSGLMAPLKANSGGLNDGAVNVHIDVPEKMAVV